VKQSPYTFSEDSELLGEGLQQIGYAENFLEIGIGYGSNLKRFAHNFALAVGTDIQTLAHMKGILSSEYEIVITDKGSCFRPGVFDVVAFNPPYLPSNAIIDSSVDGGKSGIEVPLAFLKEALRAAKSQCKVLLVLSTHCDLNEFRSFCNSRGLKFELVAQKNLFFETLLAYVIRKS